MLIDARSVPSGTVIEADICIVGGGAAGITVARELILSGHRVVLLESGDIDFDEDTQSLYGGRNLGRRYFDPKDIRLRLRFFGGTTNHWGGWCSLPDPLDFEARPGVPYSGWPFSRAYLDPWYRRAHAVLQLGPFDYAPADWGIVPADIPEPFNGPEFICELLQVSPPTRFAEEYGPELRAASQTTVYLNANAKRFNTNESGGEIQSLSVGVLPDREITFRARMYVLAAGGIENARLLLVSGSDGTHGLGNQHDLVGRFFMVHMEYPGGVIILGDPYLDFKFETGEYGSIFKQSGTERKFVSYICLSQEIRRKLNLPQIRILFGQRWGAAVEQSGELLRDWREQIKEFSETIVAKGLKTQFEISPFAAVPFYCSSEQFPNPESRIGLDTEKDRFGQPTVTVKWEPTVQDKRGMLTAHHLLGAEVGRVGLGRLWSSVPGGDNNWPIRMFGNQHNIGTTRMHRDPKFGVVDENCRVHGVSNLYIAGSSVFPTEGTNNPTLTIVALALRLADHIKEGPK